ncbi:MAG: adenylate/guanylate cyclase domain-containing protein [Deltaproteobacteria bacterium]|nr:adenylate/guanylate cyclase domain-containing protein [Deltaproteobacteria bacterium]
MAAILAADIAGYSRLIGTDEEGTLRRIRSIRAEVIDQKIAAHRGRLVKTMGDGLLVEFASVVDALRCASEVQQKLAVRNEGTPVAERIEFRIGINMGDVVVEDGDILGDGVNVAARLETLAEPGGICVSARVQEDATGRLELMFADRGKQDLKNIGRPIRAYRVLPATAKASAIAGPIAEVSALALPDKPSIAVLPFTNMSGDPEQEYFADGMVEEIITALSRIRWLFVIARNSSFVYKGQAADVKRVGRELGVRYVLEGSVRKGGGRVRISAQLVEAETGAHLWADHFDGSLDDVFDLQDRVAISAAGVIEPALQAAEARRSAHRPTNDLTAYDLYLRALPHFAAVARERLREALDLLEQAITRDLRYGPALALAAMCMMQLHLNGWAESPDVDRNRGLDYARRAVRAASNDPFVLASAAAVFGYFGEDIAATLALADRSLAANPGFAYGWFWSSVLRLYAGQYDMAIEQIEKSLRLNPLDRMGAPLTAIAGAHFFKREFEIALAKLHASIQERPGFTMSYRLLAACYAHMGRLEEARAAIERLRALTPVIAPAVLPIRSPEARELLFSGLRLAAGESAS